MKMNKSISEYAVNFDKEYQELINSMDTLEIDPQNHLESIQKQFVQWFIEYHSVLAVKHRMNLTTSECIEIYNNRLVQYELSRLFRNLFVQQITNKIATIDILGGYLTSMLIDDTGRQEVYVPSTKIQISKLIIELNKFKAQAFMNPTDFASKEVSIDTKKLTTSSIRKLIEQESKLQDKYFQISRLQGLNVLPTEKDFLLTLPLDQLTDIVNKKLEESQVYYK